MPAEVVMTSTGGVSVSEAIVWSGALLGMNSQEPGPPDSFTIDFVDWPFKEENPSWRRHKKVVREKQPHLAVAPDVEKGRSLSHVIDLADELAQYAEHVIVAPKEAHPSEVPDRFRVGLPFAANWGSGGIELGGSDDSAHSIRDFQNVGPVHVLGGAPHDQLAIPSYGVNVASVDTSLPLLYARRGRVWFSEGQVEWPGRSVYERLEASLRNIRRAWGHSAEPTLELTQVMKELLEADSKEERERIIDYSLTGARGAPPPFPPELSMEPHVEKFFSKNKYSLPDRI